MRIVNLHEIKQIEKSTFDEVGPDESVIIENVGIRVTDFIIHHYFFKFKYNKNTSEIILICGKGNNSADGLAAARNLHNRNFNVQVCFLMNSVDGSPEFLKQKNIIKKFNIPNKEINSLKELSEVVTCLGKQDLIIDAVFGTGFKLPLKSDLRNYFNIINRCQMKIVSLDIPSGVSGENGNADSDAIKSDIVAVVSVPKTGHFISEGKSSYKRMVFLDAGFDKALLGGGDKFLITEKLLDGKIPKRDRFSHKNSFGHVLIIGGSEGLAGACALSSISALKVGAGLSTAMTWSESYQELCSKVKNEVMTSKIPDDIEINDFIKNQLPKYSSILIGPGLGASRKSYKLVIEILKNAKIPVVVDADGLNVLDLNKDSMILKQREYTTILTPHMGEFSKLIELDKSEIERNKFKILKDFSKRLNVTIVLKDAFTFIGRPDGNIFVNNISNNGLATAGSGDVLAGIIVGLLGQSQSVDETNWATVAAVKIHSLSARKLEKRSLTAESIINNISEANKFLDSDES